ncbi:unnamed protein product [Rotaria sordida]|uniref:Uncharacterized protein n=1 Tax=Rotaria sordida TaxID=392033 RepID=A0A815V2G2_9BILA|nr:unnamed protein product [Rotaria sordida]CAF1527592.1 unnamed protein product [Rotaria sordida]
MTAYIGIAIFEEKLTNDQRQYLREYYKMNKNPGQKQIYQIVKQWNINDFDFFMDLIEWFFDQNLEDIEREGRRLIACRIGA